MEQNVMLPNASDLNKITQLLALSSEVANTITGQPTSGESADLNVLQAVIDSKVFDKSSTLALQAMGMSVGQVIATEDQDYDWWMVEDDTGRDPCLRYKETNLLVFPQTFISKRVEQGEEVDIARFYVDLKHQLDEARQQHFGQ